MPATPTRYRSSEEDSARWDGFDFRDGDIVISTRSKSGTTWMQMICALLVFQRAELPAPLAQLSPWLDWCIRPAEDVLARLEAQRHRRFVKTHTPLDGLPLDDRATYVVVARDPRDMYLSLYHQGANVDRDVMRQLLQEGPPARPAPKKPRPDERAGLLAWIDGDSPPREQLDSIRGVLWHLSDAWARRHASNVVLVHYDDLLRDLEGQMRRLAGLLGIAVPENVWPALVGAATFEQMKARAGELTPTGGTAVLKDVDAFFRSGTSGGWRELLAHEEVAHYEQRVAALAPPDLLAWLHR